MAAIASVKASVSEAAALNGGESGTAGCHGTWRHGKASRAETTGPETALACEAASAVEPAATETAAVKSATTTETSVTTAAAVTSSATAATRQRERRGKCANCRDGGQRDDGFLEHRSTPQNNSLRQAI
jgi:hypothetical protein